MDKQTNENMPHLTRGPRFKVDSMVLKVLMMAGIILILMIPQIMVQSLISERQQRRTEAVNAIGKMWAPAAVIHAPMIIVPYLQKVQKQFTNNANNTVYYRAISVKKYAYVMPQKTAIQSEASIKQRKRGIFKAQTFSGDLDVKGNFGVSNLKDKLVDAHKILWNESFLMISTEAKTYKDLQSISLNGKEVSLQFQNNIGKQEYPHFHAPVDFNLSVKKDANIQFQYKAKIRGTSQLSFTPYSKKMTVNMSTNWPSPSFLGSTLPADHDINQQGFKAEWESSVIDVGKALSDANFFLSFEGRYPHHYDFGVKFFDSVDIYHQSERSVKYGTLFLIITFCAFFIFEIQKKLKVHPVQYLLIGLANIMFYVMMLSVAEHAIFEIAYVLASIAVTLLISLYAKSILNSKSGALKIGGGLSLLYVCLYFILAGEDYSLLLGSFLLFACLSAVMFATRNIQKASNTTVTQEV